MMDFEKLIKNTKSDKARKKAAEGFAERQAGRESRFVAQADALEPSAEWYDRMYGARRTKRQGGSE